MPIRKGGKETIPSAKQVRLMFALEGRGEVARGTAERWARRRKAWRAKQRRKRLALQRWR